MGGLWTLGGADVGMFICTTFLRSGEIVTIDNVIDDVRDMCIFPGVPITFDYGRPAFIFRSVCPKIWE